MAAYIPLLGGALSGSQGFIYDEQKDYYICRNNKILKGSGRIADNGKGNPVKKYFSLMSDCKTFPLKLQCIGAKAKQKKIQHSYYKPQLEAAKARVQSAKGWQMRRKRSATAEPVWGTLINFMAKKRINTRGLASANKVLVMAATCYNLKKWMKFIVTKAHSNVMAFTKQKVKAFADVLNHFAGKILRPFMTTVILYSIITI